MKLSKSILLAVLATLVSAAKVSHSGTKVLRVDVRTEAQAKLMNRLIDMYDLDVWSHMHATAGAQLDVAVPADQLNAFTRNIKTAKMNSYAIHEDLGKSIEEEENTMHTFSASAARGRKPNTQGPEWWTAYHSYADHMTWLTDFQKANADKAQIVTSGQSLEKRTISGVHLYGSGGPGSKPAVIWHGTVHAREWITTMVVEYLTNQLVTTKEGRDFLEMYDFYIFPIVNPDGFYYAQNTDRMWRKNRRPGSGLGGCAGTDINRNWDAKWSNSGGASTSPCAQDYKGTAPKDTPENKGLSDFMDGIAASEHGATLFIDWHSYSQLILSPYGYDCVKTPPNHQVLMDLMGKMKTAISSKNGIKYTVGPSCSTIYKTTGDSVDYSFEKALIPHSMTVELRDTGNYGFVLPANQIVPSGEETWLGVIELLKGINTSVNSKNPVIKPSN